MTQAPVQNGASKAIVPNKPAQLKELLTSMTSTMAAVLPKHITPERMIKVVMTAAIKTPELYDCSRTSIMQAVMLAAQLGLDCGGALGEAYLIPFKGVCTLIIGYRGMISLARRSGEIKSICAVPVWNTDKFLFERSLETDKLEHKPDMNAVATAENLLGVYVLARFVDGGYHFEWMNKAQINAIRSRSRSSNSGPWVTDYIEMAKKTVIRRAFKYLPMSIELISTLENAADLPGGEQIIGDIIDTTATESEAEPSKAAQVLQDIARSRAGDQSASAPGTEGSSTPSAPAAEPSKPANVGTVNREQPKRTRGNQTPPGELLHGNVPTDSTIKPGDIDFDDEQGGKEDGQ